ncbi:MAG: tetratricopeptide repeat protein [Pseudomonadota bacterium]
MFTNAEKPHQYQQAAQQGQSQAQYQLGLIYKQGKAVPQDDALAIHWFRRAAEQGQADAQNQLGLLYKRDAGSVVQDAHADALAVNLFMSAAEQGHADAQYNLGLFYKVDRGEYAKAKYWFNKAAEQGHLLAQKTLKLMPPMPMSSRRLFLMLSSIGLAGSFLTLSACSGNKDCDSRNSKDNKDCDSASHWWFRGRGG